MAAAQASFGPWVRQTSRSTGAAYYFNAATNESLWHDDALPLGWAFGREPSGARFFVDLATGRRSAVRPAAAPGPAAAAPPATTSALQQLSFVASQTAADDVASTAYIPDPASAGANIPGKLRDKRDYLFGVTTGAGAVPEAVAWQLQCDEVSLYSITEARLAKRMTQLLIELVGAGARIVDATACVGGNTLSFASAGAFSHVTAVELSVQRARMLEHNVRICGLTERVSVLQGDFVGLMGAAVRRLASSPSAALDSERLLLDAADAVFFDPPWGGPDFHTVPQLDMFLGSTDVADVVTCLTFAPPSAAVAVAAASAPLSRLVAIKAPPNYNVDGLRAKLRACGSGAALVRVEPMHKMQLLFVQAQRAAPPLPPAHALYALMAPAPAPPPSGGGADSAVVAGVKRRAAPEGSARGDDDATAAAKAAAALRWASLDHAVQVALELLMPAAALPAAAAASGGGAEAAPVVLVASGRFLHADLATGTAELRRPAEGQQPQAWSVSAAGSGVRLGVAGRPVAVEEAADGAAVLSSGSSPAQGEGVLLSVRSSTYDECGSQFLALACGERLLHALIPPTAATGGAVSLLRHASCSSRDLIEAWAATPAAAEPPPGSEGRWLPALFRPVFAGESLAADAVFGGAAPASGGAALSADPRGALGLYARLGVPAGYVPPGSSALARGKRSRVMRYLLLPSSAASAAKSCTLKIQTWDARVAEEVEAIDAVMSVRSSAGGGGGGAAALALLSLGHLSPLLRPLAHVRDAHSSYTLMPDCGPSLEAWAEQRRLPALLDLLAGAADAGWGVSDATARAPPQSSSGSLRSLPERATLGLLAPILLALHRLHALGLLYCDLHPGNVLCDASGRITVVDFGSCRRLAAGGSYAGPTRGGRWDYMPPEQFGGGQWADSDVVMTPATDVFAAATTALFLLGGGAAPFRPAAGEKLRVSNTRNHALREPAALSAHLDKLGLPAAPSASLIGAFLRRALSPRPADRFQSAVAALEALGLRP